MTSLAKPRSEIPHATPRLDQFVEGATPSRPPRQSTSPQDYALKFSVPAPLTSNNFVKTAIRYGRSIKTAGARRDHARVFQISFAAAQLKGWAKPAAARLSIVAWNCRKDVGNIEKVIADGMIGAVYDDDRILVKLLVEKRVDAGHERYDIVVEPCAPLPSRADLKKRAKAS